MKLNASTVLSATLLLTEVVAQSPLSSKPVICGVPNRVHLNMVTCVDDSIDGTTVLTTSIEGDAKLWEMRTGKLLTSWMVDGSIDTAAFCGPKSERVMVGDSERGVRLFDARTSKLVITIPGLLQPEVSPDGTSIAATTKQGEVVFIDVKTGAKTPPAKVGKDLFNPQFSPDGKTVIVDEVLAGYAHVVDRAQRKVVGKIEHGGLFGKLAFLPDGKTVMVHARGTVRKLALPSAEVLGEWDVPRGATGMAVLGNGAEVLLADLHGGISLVELASGKVKHELEAQQGRVNHMLVASNGSVLVAGSTDGAIRFWDLAAGKEMFVGPDHNNAVTAVALSADGKTLASGSWDNSTILWGGDGKARARVRVHPYMVTAVHMNEDGTWWSTSQDSTVRCWQPDGQQKSEFKLDGKQEYARGMVLVAAGKHGIFGMSDGTVRWHDMTTGAETKRWSGHGSTVIAVAADEKGELVASLEEEGVALLWNVDTGEVKNRWVVHEKGGGALCYAGGGVFVASSGYHGSLARYDAKAGKETHRVELKGEEMMFGIGALAALRGQTFVVGASHDNLCVFSAADLTAGPTVRTSACISCLAASADGSTLAAGLEDGTSALWKMVASVTPRK